jgi:hypothetical protein
MVAAPKWVLGVDMDIFSVMMIAVSPGPARRVGINRMNIREYMNKK